MSTRIEAEPVKFEFHRGHGNGSRATSGNGYRVIFGNSCHSTFGNGCRTTFDSGQVAGEIASQISI